MTAYTRDVITETLEKIVAEKGTDYVYPRAGKTCFYSDPETGEPSCVVGHLVAALDLRLFDRLAQEEDARGGFDVVSLIDEHNLLDVGGDTELKHALQHFQTSQDHGEPWGEGLAKYHARLEGAY